MRLSETCDELRSCRSISVHFYGAGAESVTEIVELHIGMVCQKGHGDGGVGDSFGDHECGEALAEGIVVQAGLPDGDFFGHPGFFGADGDGHFGDHGDVAAAGGAGVLSEGDGMEFDDAGGEFAILGGSGGLGFVFAGAFDGVVEGPVFDIALATLHDDATDTGGPAFGVVGDVCFWEMHLAVRHDEALGDAIEAEFAIGAFEGERVLHGDFFFGVGIVPFVHAPEVAAFERDAEFGDEAGHEGELFGGADGAADAGGVVVGGLLPGVDVFEGLGEVEVLEGVVHDDFEAWAGELAKVALGEAGSVVDEVGIESGVIPPVGGDVAEFA